MKKPTEEELQKLALEAQEQQQYGQVLQNQMASISTRITEINSCVEALAGLKEKNEQVLVPLGAGAYTHAKIDKQGKVLVGIGAGIVVEKEIGDAERFYAERLKHLEGAHGKLAERLGKVSLRLQALDSQARKAIAEMKGSDVQRPEE